MTITDTDTPFCVESGFKWRLDSDGALEMVIGPRRDLVYTLGFSFVLAIATFWIVGWTMNGRQSLSNPGPTSPDPVIFLLGLGVGALFVIVLVHALLVEQFLASTIRVGHDHCAVRVAKGVTTRWASAPLAESWVELPKPMWLPVEQPELLDKKFKEPPLAMAPTFIGVQVRLGRRAIRLGQTLTELETVRLLRVVQEVRPDFFRSKSEPTPEA